MRIFHNMQLSHKIKMLEEKYYANILFPDEIQETLSDLIGMKAEKETLQDVLNFFKGVGVYSEGSILRPATHYLLGGALGSGKTPLMRALAKDSNVPLVTFVASTFAAFPKKVLKIIDLIFEVVNSFEDGCILTFENFTSINALDSEHIMLFHNRLAAKIRESENTVVILQTISENIALPPMYFEHNMFNLNRVITVMPPTLESRKELFAKNFNDFGIAASNDIIERLAKNTLGMYPKDIEYVVQETLLRATRTGSKKVEFKDFQETLLLMDAGQEHHSKLSDEERKATAYHEAGHVIAAYYSNPKYILGRVEITPRAQSLGLTLEEVGEEKYSYFKKDFEYQIIYCLGGMAAEKIIYGETSAGVSVDLQAANEYALNMVMAVGMSDELGPIVFDDETGFASEEFFTKAERIVQTNLKDLLARTIEIVSSHRKQLDALTNALLESEVLVGDEIKKVLDEAE